MAKTEILTYDYVIEYLAKNNRQKHLLLGNGFSMAYDSGIFSYNALNKFIESIDKTVTSYKVIYRNIRKCSYDTNMDCFNNNTRPKGTQGNGKIPMVSIKLSCIYQIEYFC